MPFYADAQFNVSTLLPVYVTASAGFNTTTAGTSPTVLSTVIPGTPIPIANQMPVFINRTAIKNISVTTVAAPGVTPGTLGVLNGTNTVGSVVVGTAAGVTVTGTFTANNTFAAGGTPTFQYQGTASATTVSIGAYNVWLEIQELYA